jgi:hypothetical protein
MPVYSQEINTGIKEINNIKLIVGYLETDQSIILPENISTLKVWAGLDEPSQFEITFFDIEDNASTTLLECNTPFELPIINGKTYYKIGMKSSSTLINYQYLIL